MSETLKGRGGPGRGQGRKTNTEKGEPAAKKNVLSIKVEDDLKDWIASNGGGAFAYDLLRSAYIKSLIV